MKLFQILSRVTDTQGKWQMVVYHCVGGEVARGEGGEGLMATA